MQKPHLNATIAKARALWGKRLREEDYKRLAGFTSVTDVAEYLYENTYYRDALSGVDLRTIHRGYLESLIRTSALNRYLNLCDFQKLSNRPFFEFYLKSYEINELMRFVMYFNSGSTEHFLSKVPTFLLKDASFDIHALSKAQTKDELLAVIRHTPYYDIINEAGLDSKNRINYPRCEVLLRTYYLTRLRSIVEKTIDNSERDELIMQINQQIDLINIINSYRLKAFFDLDNSAVMERMLPFKGRMSNDQKQKLMSAENIDEYLSAFSHSIYGRQLGYEKALFFEENISRLRMVSAKRGLMSARGVSSCLYCLDYLFGIEADNIVTIIEGIRYKKPYDVIMNYVIY
ncbi:MAG: V-type ATPase subunit [Oscillospiraceae bacterium]|nr:V-type ATPase subunit [Oscillospiraceae bacterium]